MLNKNSVMVRFAKHKAATRLNCTALREMFYQMESMEDRCLLSAVLGTAGTFAVLAGSTVTNSGATVLNGDLGVSPGTAITGFPPGIVLAPGQIHATDAVAQQAEADATTAYNMLAALPTTQTLTGQDLGGLKLTPGVYTFASSAQLTGTLTLDAQNNPNARFVFQIGSTLTTASASKVQLINAPDCFDNIFWQVGSSATLGSTSNFDGTIIASASISMDTGATITDGGALALTGAVTLLGNTISPDHCGSISGTKFQDTNGDGIRETGEPGLQGVTVFLDANGNGVPDNGEASTVTDANGGYVFSHVNPGTYSAREVVPTGWIQTTANPLPVVVANSPTGTTVAGGDFGDFQLGRISGTKFQDRTGNGPTADDTPLKGVTIKLYRDVNGNGAADAGDGAAVQTTVTDANGAYTFAGLTANAYVVSEVVPSGYIHIGPTSYPASIISGSNVVGKNLYDYQLRGCKVGGVTFIVTSKGVSKTYATLAGHVHSGDTVMARFTIPAGTTDQISLVSYVAPSADFSQLSKQVVSDQKTGTFGSGTHTLTVVVPKTFFQVDMVCGSVIPTFGAAGSNIFYTPQQRLISAIQGSPGPNLPAIAASPFPDSTGNKKAVQGGSEQPGSNIFVDTNGKNILDNGRVCVLAGA